MDICHIASGDLWAGAENQFYNIIAGLRKKDYCHVIAIIMNGGKLYEKLIELGITTYLVDETKKSLIGQLLMILVIIRRNRIRIIHSHRYKENILAGLVKLCFPSLVLIKTQHGTFNLIDGLSSFRMKIYRLIDLLFTKTVFDRIVGVSKDISRQFEKYVKLEKIETVMNSICPEMYRVSEQKAAQCNMSKNRILKMAVIGRLVKIKNIDEFVDIVRGLFKLGCNISALIVGAGPEQSRLKELSGPLYHDNVIRFCGEVTDISEILSELDILFLTSIHEGLPTVLLEAMYFRKIVIARPVGGIPEVLKDNQNGFFYYDVPQAIDLVMRIYEAPFTFESIRRKAKETVERSYTNTQQAKKYMEIYADALLEKL